MFFLSQKENTKGCNKPLNIQNDQKWHSFIL